MTSGIASGQYNIVIDSIGSAGIQLIHNLKQVSKLDEQQLAKALFQAPALLLSGLEKKLAQEVNQLLRSTGAETRVCHQSDEWEAGDGDHEVALVVQNHGRIPQVLKEIIAICGVSPEVAIQMLYNTPTVLLGQISSNTVTELKKRFTPLEVQLDVSLPAKALYDVYLGGGTLAERSEIVQAMRGIGVSPANGRETLTTEDPLLATDIDYPTSQKLWQILTDRKISFKILNRDYQRFDLKLEQGQFDQPLCDYLQNEFKIPDKIIPKLKDRLPIVVLQNAKFDDMQHHIAALHELGAKATGHLLAFQRFDLKLTKIDDASKAAQKNNEMTGQSQKSLNSLIKSNKVIPGPFSALQARWIGSELKKLKTESRLVLRT